MTLCAGDWVEVRSRDEILASLDKDGRLEGLPFMPEMLEYCGKRVRVSSSAHKTCGPIQGNYLALQTRNIVHLGNRCDGKAHGGCQNACQIFWHAAWLKSASNDIAPVKGAGCTLADLEAATRQPDRDGSPCYMCQAVALPNYTQPLKWWDARQYWKSYQTRNHTLGEVLSGVGFMVFCKIAGRYGERFGARRIYDAFQSLRGGSPFPRRHGLVPDGEQTPVVTLGLKAGDYVRVKSHEDILDTLTHEGKNRGMFFDAELVPFCGGVYRVHAMVERFIDEEAGVMRHLKTPAAILENVYCLSLYTGKRTLCTRGYCSWWREAWLEPVSEAEAAADRAARAREAVEPARETVAASAPEHAPGHAT